MFGKKEDISKIDTIIGKGGFVRGDIEVSKSMMVEGRIEGNVTVKGQLILSKDAYIKGDVSCDELITDGTIEGKVKVKTRAEIQKHGKIIGEIHCRLLVVEEGGFINGLTNMMGDTPEPISKKGKKEEA